jgi:hypothetical protein
LTFDIPRLLNALDSADQLRNLLHGVQPIEVTLNRSLLSAFDATPVTPPLTYQLALGGTSLFRSISGREATASGVVTQLSASNTIDLPMGAVFSNRYQRINSRNWAQRFDNSAAVYDATQTVLPDLSLRWAMRPRFLSALVSSISSNARYVQTKQLNAAPEGEAGGVEPGLFDQGTSVVKSYPLSTTIVWAGQRPFSSTLGYSVNQNRESRPGMSSNGTNADWNAELGKPFRLPPAWGLPGDLRTRVSYQSTHGNNFILNPLSSTLSSRLSDNGRRAFSFSADTDVSENLSSSFVISRLVSFDRNLNRNFTQTVLSAVMHLQFFGGDAK